MKEIEYLPACSWIDDSEPGGKFGRMNVNKYEKDQSACVITFSGDGKKITPCEAYNVTVTSTSDYGHAVSAVGATIDANANFNSYEIQPGCRGQQSQMVSHFSFVAPEKGAVTLSALCGQPNIMYTAKKVTLKVKKGTGNCPPPTNKPTKSPTFYPTSSPLSCSSITKAKACKKASGCAWNSAEGVCQSNF